MYPILIGEMKSRQITAIEISQKLGIHQNSMYSKLNGKKSFTLDEALLIKKLFFDDLEIGYLFYRKNEG